MPVRVIDASALGALLFVEPRADEVATVTTGVELIAPALLPFEMASIGRKKCHAIPAHRDRFLRILSRIADMGIRYTRVEPADMVALALDAGITTYDAAYLCLAVLNDASLVTLDAAFAKAAAKVLPRGRILPQKH